MPLALFIGLSDLYVVKLLFFLTGVHPRTRLADFHMADKNEFRLTMRNFYRLRVKRGLIQPIERMVPENEKLKGSWRRLLVGVTVGSKARSCAKSRRRCMR